MSAEKEKESGFRALGLNAVLGTLVAAVLIGSSLLGWLLLQRTERLAREAMGKQLGAWVVQSRILMETYLNERLDNLRYLAQALSERPEVSDLLLRDALLGLQQTYGPVFVHLTWIGADGKQLAQAGIPEKADFHPGEEQRNRKALLSPDLAGRLFPGSEGDSGFIAVVKTRKHGYPSLLRAVIDLSASPVSAESFRMGQTGQVFILDATGRFLSRSSQDALLVAPQRYLEILFHGTEPAGQGSTLETHVNSSQRAGLRGEDRRHEWVVTLEKDPGSGKDLVLAAAAMSGSDWFFVLQQDFDEAFEAWSRAGPGGIWIIALGACLMAAVTFVLGIRLRRQPAADDFQKEMVNQQIIETGKLATIGELAAGIAHEINNPVAIMVTEAGWIEDLLEEGIGDEENLKEFKRALKQIQTQGRRCREISHKLLSFARKTDSRMEMVQINELIEEVVQLCAQRAKYDNVEIRTVFEPDLPYLELSMTEMQQVFLNIIHNALDAMDRKGGLIEISTGMDRGQVAITIRDTGPGIELAHLGRVFDPFFTTKPVGKGTGLGLSICYGIIKKMGGNIEVESAPGKGARFRILLPLSRASESTGDLQEFSMP